MSLGFVSLSHAMADPNQSPPAATVDDQRSLTPPLPGIDEPAVVEPVEPVVIDLEPPRGARDPRR